MWPFETIKLLHPNFTHDFNLKVSLLRELRHPNVVLLVGVCTSSHLPLMVLEYMSLGSLYKYLHNPQTYVNETQVIFPDCILGTYNVSMMSRYIMFFHTVNVDKVIKMIQYIKLRSLFSIESAVFHYNICLNEWTSRWGLAWFYVFLLVLLVKRAPSS